MTDETETIGLLVSVSMMMLVVGLLVLDEAVWYVQYSALFLSLALSLFAVTRSELLQADS